MAVLGTYLGVGKDTLRKIVTISKEGTETEIKEANSKKDRSAEYITRLKNVKT